MHCAGCVAFVEKSLMGVDGVQSAVFNLSLENVRIEKNLQVTFEKLHNDLQKAGYTLVEVSWEQLDERKEIEIHIWRQRLIYKGLLGLPLLIFAMLEMMEGDIITSKSIIVFVVVESIITEILSDDGKSASLH